jgi:hypothetical protein
MEAVSSSMRPGQKKKSRLTRRPAPSSPWPGEAKLRVPPLPCSRPYHATLRLIRDNLCDLNNTEGKRYYCNSRV